MGAGLENRCLEEVGKAGNSDEGSVQVLNHGRDMAQGRASGTDHSRYSWYSRSLISDRTEEAEGSFPGLGLQRAPGSSYRGWAHGK